MGIKNISIPQACHESWQSMAPVDKGRYCQSCCKTVTDFTGMSNAEVINYLADRTNSCGRFSDVQLKSINHQLYIENQQPVSQWKRLALFVGVIGSSVYFKADAQTKPSTSKYPVTKQNGKDKPAPITTTQFSSNRIITGRVFDDTLAVAGATVMVKGLAIKTSTALNGEYKIELPANADTLTVSFIGYETAYIDISQQSQTKFDVKLKEDPQLNDVVLVGAYQVRQSFFQRMWHSITHIF
ncbi:CarboxypepD_reg-like domain-containing protein [Mucilaginibacter pineti]|uniref:CarboxypepD_reg-like domain-containing protein n=1 Tax=Mucilaginibacter pineti TaxID=1391627 RepID=A0A1G6YSA2_9SPHI|nr:carboxypeptidase-like regulatory domain-containing protein [Mucilaginibacter pineti]SDD92436.1 CarboxypepD_reg-like domain-containing protein [Mucilaginibacter pineti]